MAIIPLLESNTVYNPDRLTYRYRPRGLYDCEFRYGPYPEVVGYEEQADGTIKLLVEAVWETKELDQAISSELVVRPLKNGQIADLQRLFRAGVSKT